MKISHREDLADHNQNLTGSVLKDCMLVGFCWYDSYPMILSRYPMLTDFY